MKPIFYSIILSLLFVAAGCAGAPEPAPPEAPAAPVVSDSLSAEDLSILLAPDEPVAPAPPVTPSNYRAALDSLEARND